MGKTRPSQKANTRPYGVPAYPTAKMLDAPVIPQLQASFCYNLYKSAMRCRTLLDNGLDKLQIIMPQLGILKMIAINGPMSQQELGDLMGIDKTSMVKFIDGLQKLKAVVRKPVAKDRRVKLVTLTPLGRKLLDRAFFIRSKIEDEFLSVLTKEESDSLREIMPKLLQLNSLKN